jgi:hypothetical protein
MMMMHAPRQESAAAHAREFISNIMELREISDAVFKAVLGERGDVL